MLLHMQVTVEAVAPARPPTPISPPGSEVSDAAEYYFRQYGDGHIEDVGLTSGEKKLTVEAESTGLPEGQRPHSAPAEHGGGGEVGASSHSSTMGYGLH